MNIIIYLQVNIRVIVLILFPWFLVAPQPMEARQMSAAFTGLLDFGRPLPEPATVEAWKNETILLVLKVHAQEGEPITLSFTSDHGQISTDAYQLAYVKGDFSAGYCGEKKKASQLETEKFPDRAEPILGEEFVPDSSTVYLLFKVKVGEEVPAGEYELRAHLAQGQSDASVSARVTVLEQTLPAMDQLGFRVDFWQHPHSIAEYYQVEPFSDAHFQHIETMFRHLKAINQSSITTSIFWDLFNPAKKAPEHMMIQISKLEDGSFAYDYSNFEKYVELGLTIGIQDGISVHNIFPWNAYHFYYDVSVGEVKAVRSKPMSETYQAFWGQFLTDFRDFLIQKEWLDKVVLVIDERDAGQTLEVAKFILGLEPRFKIGYAGRFYADLSPLIHDYSLPANVLLEDDVLQSRREYGQETTLYTTCYDKEPNMLMMNNYGDIYFLIMLAKAKGYDGVLRWAFNLWSSRIMENAIYADLPSGDAHFVYPEGQASLRYWVILDALEEVLKFETKSHHLPTRAMLEAHKRYFLLNVESSRLEMVRGMRRHLTPGGRRNFE